jgi:signal transduction histidine kinase/DNA-binding response OmpR family regulator
VEKQGKLQQRNNTLHKGRRAYQTFTLSLFALLLLGLWSEHGKAAALIHLHQPDVSLPINSHIDILEDPGGLLEFSDVTAPPYLNMFTPANPVDLQLGFSQSAYWLRFSIQNNQDRDQQLWLDVRPPNIQHLALYQTSDPEQPIRNFDQDKMQHEKSIMQHPLLTSITIPAKTTTAYYLRIQSNTPLNLDLMLSSPNSFVVNAIKQANFTSTAYGILLALCFINLIMAVVFREGIYLSYAVYLLALMGFQAAAGGVLHLLFPSLTPWPVIIIFTFIFIANSIAFCFAYLLLRYQSLHIRWRTIILAATLLNLITYLSVYFTDLPTSYLMLFIGIIATTIILIGAPIHCFVAGQNRAALVIGISRFWTILSVATGIYAIQTTLTEIHMARLWVSYAFSLEAIVVTAALLTQSLKQQKIQTLEKQVIAIAEAETRAQADILGRISHDIRTPMSGVIGMTELLLDTPLTPSQKDHVDTIQNSGQALLTLISDILDRSRIDAGNMEIEKMPFDLAFLINECIDNFRSQAEENNIELISHIHADVPVLVIGDVIRLRQILMHLLGNACKYTEHGEIVLTVATDYEKQADAILFTVADTGRGISKSDQKHLFSQNLHGRKSNQFHFGLGLAVSKQLINKMQGDIGVESELGKGSKFWVCVPLPAQQLSEELKLDIEKGLRNKRMLVVDDNKTCRKVIQQQASAWGMKVGTAHSGNEAIAMLRAKANVDEAYDILIIDHKMPNMTGLQLAEKVIDDLPADKQPLMIMLTGLSNAPSLATAREAGIRRVLTKPVTGKALKITLAEELDYIHANPVLDVDPHPLQPSPADSTDTATRLKVLLVEDNPVSQKVIISMLRKLNTECQTANNGLQALEAVQSTDFDLVLMDCEMPIMDGFNATRQIREWEKDQHLPALPIIALTAHIMDEHKKLSKAAGMNAYLIKPVEINQLQATIKRWTKSKPVA